MESDDIKKGFEKPNVDEEQLMNAMSDDSIVHKNINSIINKDEKNSIIKVKDETNTKRKKIYESIFLINRYPSGRNGKVVYIRPEYHERLLRIVRLTREERTTLYSYIDNILENHFKEFGMEITDFFNERNKPIM